jgi:NADPH:quinone reductase-like Zn-dependent oxidoreductase
MKFETVDHLAAAAVPLGALTAWQALHEHAKLAPGQHVLVHGGAGGVGAYATQLAVQHGARVTATASARNLAFVTGLGAHDVLDYSGRFEDHVRDVDVVIDPVGGTTTARSWPVLRSGGILVDIAEEPDQAKGAATTSAACTSWSGPTAATCANWPAWSMPGGCARSCRRSST